MHKYIPISKYFEIQNPEYVYLKLIPSKSIRNNRTYSIMNLVNKMYLNLNKLIRIEDKKLIIRTQYKASYYIHITKDEYEELIECKLHINMLHRYITKEHEDNIRLRGCKQSTTDMLTIETLSGYMDNEKHFDRLKREFKERVRQKCE